MLRSKIVHLKEIYNFDLDHFLIKRTVFILIMKNVIKNKKLNFSDKLCDIQKKILRYKIVRFKKCKVFVLIVKNLYGKSSAKREYRNENVFLKGDRALSKLITLLISNKKKFYHFFKSRSSDIVLLKQIFSLRDSFLMWG